MQTDPEHIAKIAAGLTKAQRDWILAMPDIPVAISGEDWDAAPDLYVQFRLDEYCPETGFYLGGGQRHWFGSMTAHYHGDGGPLMFSACLNALGLEVRKHLQENPDAQ
jgi:hypothetical protein